MWKNRGSLHRWHGRTRKRNTRLSSMFPGFICRMRMSSDIQVTEWPIAISIGFLARTSRNVSDQDAKRSTRMIPISYEHDTYSTYCLRRDCMLGNCFLKRADQMPDSIHPYYSRKLRSNSARLLLEQLPSVDRQDAGLATKPRTQMCHKTSEYGTRRCG